MNAYLSHNHVGYCYAVTLLHIFECRYDNVGEKCLCHWHYSEFQFHKDRGAMFLISVISLMSVFHSLYLDW